MWAPGHRGDGLPAAQAILQVLGKTSALRGVTKREVGVEQPCPWDVWVCGV